MVGVWNCLWGMVFVALTDVEEFGLKLCGTIAPFGAWSCVGAS